MEEIRLNKYLSEQGVCSRREADRLIEAGKVTIDGRRAEMGREGDRSGKDHLRWKTGGKGGRQQKGKAGAAGSEQAERDCVYHLG